ncbi:MAG TPA: hypothetical protein VEA69_13470 [Tepidisphaeraceae bacterium]|nr:hypothetical protein [Tepidisphaeraceae bacterium]
MHIGTLTIRDRVFAVTSATLHGYITTAGDDWACEWHVEIDTEERRFAVDDEPDVSLPWKPAAYVHHLRAGLKSWRDFDGAAFEGEDEQGPALSVLRGETAYRLYVVEHAEVKRNRLEFSNRDGNVFDLVWTGAAEVFAGEEYDDDVPFRVEAKIRFGHVAVSLSTRDEDAPPPPVAEVFAKALDLAAFRQGPTRESRDSSGARTWRTEFEPV